MPDLRFFYCLCQPEPSLPHRQRDRCAVRLYLHTDPHRRGQQFPQLFLLCSRDKPDRLLRRSLKEQAAILHQKHLVCHRKYFLKAVLCDHNRRPELLIDSPQGVQKL